jgi:hypothetical protein
MRFFEGEFQFLFVFITVHFSCGIGELVETGDVSEAYDQDVKFSHPAKYFIF